MTDDELLVQFEAKTLPFEVWQHHRCHVKVAYIYLQKFSFAEAVEKMRVGVQAFNRHNNVPEGPMSGYNDTTTQAFMHLIAAVMKAYGEFLPVKSADEFCDTHPQLMSKHVLRFFYSPERRLDPRAKTQFVEPDLTPLPRIL